MPKPNSGPTNRNFGINHGAGKGDKTRVTNIKAYRENFDEIEWSRPVEYSASTNTHRILGRNELIKSGDEFWSPLSKRWSPVKDIVGDAVSCWFSPGSPVRRPELPKDEFDVDL